MNGNEIEYKKNIVRMTSHVLNAYWTVKDTQRNETPSEEDEEEAQSGNVKGEGTKRCQEALACGWLPWKPEPKKHHM